MIFDILFWVVVGIGFVVSWRLDDGEIAVCRKARRLPTPEAWLGLKLLR